MCLKMDEDYQKGGMLRMQEIIKAVAVGIFTIIMAVINQCDEK